MAEKRPNTAPLIKVFFNVISLTSWRHFYTAIASMETYCVHSKINTTLKHGLTSITSSDHVVLLRHLPRPPPSPTADPFARSATDLMLSHVALYPATVPRPTTSCRPRREQSKYRRLDQSRGRLPERTGHRYVGFVSRWNIMVLADLLIIGGRSFEGCA